jgi:hypothetical protein
VTSPSPQRKPLSEAKRSAILDQQLMAMAANGYRVEYRLPTSAVIAWGQPVNTVAHLLMCLFCCGAWIPIWLIAELTGGERRSTISVDEWGGLQDTQRANDSRTKWLMAATAVILLVWIVVLANLH